MAANESTEGDVLRALNHPVRRRILAMIDEGEASSKELASRLELPVPNVSYHVGILRDLGLIKVVRETPRRGAVERHYRATRQTTSVRQVLDWTLEADRAKPKGWTAQVVEVDTEGRKAVEAAIDKMWKEVAKAADRSAARARRSQSKIGRRVVVTVNHDPD